MKTKSLLFLMVALLAVSLSSCTKTKLELTWTIYTTPADTEEAKFVAGKVDNVLTSYYQDLGKYTPGYSTETATFSPSVIITGDSYDQVYKKVDDATKLADQVLTEEMDYGTLTKCQVVVRLFDHSVPADVWNKEYITDK